MRISDWSSTCTLPILIRGHDKRCAQFEQAKQQAVQDHGVGHIRNMKLVEADQAIALGDTRGDDIERIGLTLDPIEFAMNTAHEFVKVNAGLAAHGHRQVERIHQKAFPATHPAPHVYAARSEEPTSELQSIMRIPYAVFC